MESTQHVTDLLADFLAGTCNESDQNAIQVHLQSCAACRQEYENLSTLWNSLGAIPGEEPNPQARDRFKAMLAAYEQGMRHASPGLSLLDSLDAFVARLWPRRPVIQLAIAVVLFLFGAVIGRRVDRATESPSYEQTSFEIAQLHDEIRSMRGMLAVSLMQQQSASDRLKGITMSTRIAEENPQVMQSLLDALRYDPSVNVRLAALEAVTGSMDNPDVRSTIVQALPKQSSPLVQLAMVELIVGMRDKGSLGVLNKMEKDPKVNEVVKKRIQQGIKLLL